MNRSTLHLLGAALLLSAAFIAWPKTEASPSTAEPQISTRKIDKDTAPKPSSSPRPDPEPILETPLIKIHSPGLVIFRLSSDDETLTALAQVRELPSSLTRDKAIGSLIAKLSPQRATEEWLKWKHARTDPWLEAAGEICLKLAEDDPFGPADFINEHLPESARFQIWHKKLFQKMDFQSTADVLDTLPLHRDSIRRANHVAKNWIQTDPEACLTWLDQYLPQLTREQARDFVQSSYIYIGNLEPDLEKRIAAFNQATHPKTREYLARLVLDTKNSDKETRSKFLDGLAKTLPDLHRERTAAANSPVQKIYADPGGFANALDTQKFESLALDEWQLLISELGDRSPAMAAKTLVKFGDIRGSQLSSSLIWWHKIEPVEAMEFASNLPKTKVHQEAIYDFANKTAHFKDKETTEQLIALLSSAEDQQKLRAKLAE